MRGFFVGLFILVFVALVTSACSKEGPPAVTSFEGHGTSWEVRVEPAYIEKNARRFFIIIYSYKGSNNELREISQISFAQGTQLGTQVVNVFDNSHKQKLIAEGKYEEDTLDRYGTVFMDLKNKNDNDFKIEYWFDDTNKDFDVIKAIENDRINLQINWIDTQGEHKESITIKGNKKHKSESKEE